MKLKLFAIAVALTLSVSSFAESKANKVWQIGKFDGSSAEFADGQPHDSVQYIVDQDHPETAWYSFARAAATSTASGPDSAPRDIVFSGFRY